MLNKSIFIFILLPNVLTANTKEYCIAKTNIEKVIGLTKFNTKEEFIKKCNGKMIFIYEDNNCRFFTMKNMKFDIYIKDENNTSLFKINERKKVCGKEIIEYVNK
ncbi:hypothetical protein [Halarcobacter sp.]|uniref:hypothetical protein n=1 Tax=Halarcobacter sp. TaxID=2321133 RepID=UPI003A945415